MNNLTPIIFNSITILLSAIVYVYINNLEKNNCDCSKVWMREYVKYGSIVHILYLGILIILAIINPFLILKIPTFILLIIGLYIISYTVISIVYYFHLVKKNNCVCSNTW